MRAWQVEVGRVKLYLLDSNDAANIPAHRGITSELYGGGPDLRLKQELIFGIGGWRLLETLGIQPEVCHLNEGHAAFAVLDRARCFMEDSGQPFDVALTVTRAGNLFTTHTAVAAGFDRFQPRLIEEYLCRYAAKDSESGSLSCLLWVDEIQTTNQKASTWLTWQSGEVEPSTGSATSWKSQRKSVAPLFPAWPIAEVPVGHVTNGVHMPSWDSAAADDLWTGVCSKDRWRERPRRSDRRIM